MPKINYDFDADPIPPSPDAPAGRKWRLLVIFLAIAAITGCGIYFLRPGNAEKPRQEAAPAPTTENPVGEYLLPAGDGKVSQLPVSDPVLEVEGGEGAAPESTPPEEEPEEAPAPVAVTEPVIEPEYTAEPEKDKPWIGDTRVPDGILPVDPGLNSAALGEAEGTVAILKGELEAGRYEAVRDGVLELFGTKKIAENSAPWREAAKLLTEANFRMLETGTVPKRGALTHAVKAGDYLGPLARKNHVPIEEVMAYSKLKSPNHIRVGQTLKIYPGPWRIRVEKSARLLKLYNENPAFPHLFAVFDIGIGRQNLTPSANFVISTRLKNPTWYTPDGKVYPYGDPGNVLGTRFLKLAPAGTPDKPLLGYGIHGTTREESVTRSESGGCVRMRNRDVERFFLVAPTGTPVEIID